MSDDKYLEVWIIYKAKQGEDAARRDGLAAFPTSKGGSAGFT